MTTPEHSLHLDQRQRGMLAAMGIAFWWPDTQNAAQHSPTTSTLAPAGEGTPEPTTARPHRPAVNIVANTSGTPKEATKTTANKSIQISAEAVFQRDSDTARRAHASPVSAMDWRTLTDTIQGCRACRLCEGRQQAVVGAGPTRARWMIVGEAPDELSDQMGQPFAGPVGELLDAMLTAMGLTRETDVYLANVLKCRPPVGHHAEPQDVAQCAPFLQRQIELVQPDLILALGRLAAHTVLQGSLPNLDTLPLGKLRAQVHMAQGRPVVVTYHPGYLLRNPGRKGEAWHDLCLAMRHLGHNPLSRAPSEATPAG